MARRKRFFKSDSAYHIICKFQPDITLQPSKIRQVKNCIRLAVKKYKVLVGYYVILGNHIHMIIYFPNEIDCSSSKFMHWLGTKTAICINKMLNRYGHVFRDRFKSILIDTQRYFNKLFDYLMNNPLKHLKMNPKDWPFSSYYFYNYPNRNDHITTHYSKFIQ